LPIVAAIWTVHCAGRIYVPHLLQWRVSVYDDQFALHLTEKYLEIRKRNQIEKREVSSKWFHDNLFQVQSRLRTLPCNTFPLKRFQKRVYQGPQLICRSFEFNWSDVNPFASILYASHRVTPQHQTQYDETIAFVLSIM
jgi:hypothetical protein